MKAAELIALFRERQVGDFKVFTGLRPPVKRSVWRRTTLAPLIELAQAMQVGEAALLTLSQAQQLRQILTAQGYACASDGWRSPERGKALVFKLEAS
jgi:hypothetical protein